MQIIEVWGQRTEAEIVARVRDMQGVPAQLEYLKSDGKRRHPSYCIFHEGTGKKRICTNPQCEVYYKNCSSAKNCNYYEEKER